MIFESIKMVLKIFRTNKLRTILTMIGMIIGILSVVMIMSISNAAKKTVANDLESLNNSVINVSIFQSENNFIFSLFDSMQKELIKCSGIESIAKRIEFDWKELNEVNGIDNIEIESSSYYEYEEVYEYTICEAVNVEYFEINEKLKEKLIDGRLFNKIDENNKVSVCVIREDVANKFFSSNNYLGQKIMINNQEVKIIGVMESNMTEYDYPYISDVYILADYLLNCNDNIDILNMEYQIKPISFNAREETLDSTKNILNEYIAKEDYYIDEYYASSEDITNQILDLITIVFIGIASISLLVGGIGIMNILLVSVNERIKEIGIRRAVGAKKSNIIMQFLIEAIFITIMSGITAIILAILCTNLLNSLLIDYNLNLTIDIGIILKIIIVCGYIGVIFGIYPAIKASKLNPADALRYE